MRGKQKKKHEKGIQQLLYFSMILLLAVTVSLGLLPAKAQAAGADAQTLTVCDGDILNDYVPVYGFYADAYLKAHFIYPADDLADMDGSPISKMEFYQYSCAVDSWGSANFCVYLSEVDDTTISAFADVSNMTKVYEGSLDGTTYPMEVSFETEYEYQGGNLLVCVENTDCGAYKSVTFYGVGSPGSCVQGYSYSSPDAVSTTQRDFLPKTTFTYIKKPEQVISVENPLILHYGDTGCEVGAELTTGDGTLSYAVTDNGTSVSVDATTGALTINGLGDTEITITASGTADYEETKEAIIVSVEKGIQKISAGDMTILKNTTGIRLIDAVELKKGDGELSFFADGDVVAIDDPATGALTTLNCGLAVVNIKASETEYYQETTKDILITVTEKPTQVIEADDLEIEEGTTDAKISATLVEGDGKLSYQVIEGTCIDINEKTGAITVNGTGDAVVAVIASETDNYAETYIEVKVTVKGSEGRTVEEVEALIDEIGDVNTSDECVDRIFIAYFAFCGLSEEDQLKVSNIQKLWDALDLLLAMLEKTPDYLDPLRTDLSLAAEQAKTTGQPQVVDYTANYALPLEFMKTLKENPLVTLNYHIEYYDMPWTITINATNAIADENIPWYGPGFLIHKYFFKK